MTPPAPSAFKTSHPLKNDPLADQSPPLFRGPPSHRANHGKRRGGGREHPKNWGEGGKQSPSPHLASGGVGSDAPFPHPGSVRAPPDRGEFQEGSGGVTSSLVEEINRPLEAWGGKRGLDRGAPKFLTLPLHPKTPQVPLQPQTPPGFEVSSPPHLILDSPTPNPSKSPGDPKPPIWGVPPARTSFFIKPGASPRP